jgi:transposase
LGTNPIQAEKFRPDRKAFGSATLATRAVASAGPTSSHHWSRALQALGHTVRLMPPVYVKPYVKRQKNDAADAEAICEAVGRANMRRGSH